MQWPLTHCQLGTWTTTQACALTQNQTGNLLVHRLALNPLSHTSQGLFSTLYNCLFLLSRRFSFCFLAMYLWYYSFVFLFLLHSLFYFWPFFFLSFFCLVFGKLSLNSHVQTIVLFHPEVFSWYLLSFLHNPLPKYLSCTDSDFYRYYACPLWHFHISLIPFIFLSSSTMEASLYCQAEHTSL